VLRKENRITIARGNYEKGPQGKKNAHPRGGGSSPGKERPSLRRKGRKKPPTTSSRKERKNASTAFICARRNRRPKKKREDVYTRCRKGVSYPYSRRRKLRWWGKKGSEPGEFLKGRCVRRSFGGQKEKRSGFGPSSGPKEETRLATEKKDDEVKGAPEKECTETFQEGALPSRTGKRRLFHPSQKKKRGGRPVW